VIQTVLPGGVADRVNTADWTGQQNRSAEVLLCAAWERLELVNLFTDVRIWCLCSSLLSALILRQYILLSRLGVGWRCPWPSHWPKLIPPPCPRDPGPPNPPRSCRAPRWPTIWAPYGGTPDVNTSHRVLLP
jgi:hypothetical protein